MRKLTLTLALLVAFGWVSAQNQLVAPGKKTNDISAEKMSEIKKSTKSFVDNRNAQNKAVESRWYSPAFAIDELMGGVGTSAANYLFPDSTMMVDYSNGLGGTWIHSIGEVLDPQSDWYSPLPGQTVMEINEHMPYQIDSLAIYAIYARKSAAGPADTLLIQVQTDLGTGFVYWHQGTSAWVMTDYGTDTLMIRKVNRDYPGLYMTTTNTPGTYNIKIVLDQAVADDTLSNGINYIKVAPAMPIMVTAGATVSTSYTFIPGYTWTPNVDTMASNNRFRFVSMEENGDAGGAGTLPAYTKRDWTCSTILPTSIKHNNGWDSQYPAFGYGASYAYEHHWVEFLLTADVTAIETADNGGLNVRQNRPNPFNGSTTIEYTLETSAKVLVDIYNVAGAKVMSIDKGDQTAGQHSMTIDASNLQSGVYYYTFTADGERTTKKMIVY